MKHTTYLQEKFYLKQYAINNIDYCKNDKPKFREMLNNYTDSLIKSNIWLKFSEQRQKMYFNWLQNYTCELHKLIK